ncbi:hypothetical protein [Paracerasibacillus soli]|uniref:DUF3899 domain-containing protein n=1 Tax=Paracerasibacillus soli TaxID=480284 RepID=A0ABU5CVZ5_9BACI|nr:hypothetical protein [Virgibacillus soli]MDY0410506.1 hypothetical protein [Virgibacillus soli]
MDFIITYQWEIFISMEVLSFLSLVLFLFIRYALKKRLLSQTFLFIFLLLLLLEGVLALVVYKATGEIETFQIIILVFLVYACTFGIADFKKLDRWIKQKVGKWQGVDLLTEKDKQIMAKERDSHAVARKYRIGWYVHTAIFIIAQSIFLLYFGNDHLSLKNL